MGPGGGSHTTRNRALRLGWKPANGRSQQSEFVDEALQNVLEGGPDLAVGRLDLDLRAGGTDDQVDGTVLEVKPPPVGQQTDVRPVR